MIEVGPAFGCDTTTPHAALGSAECENLRRFDRWKNAVFSMRTGGAFATEFCASRERARVGQSTDFFYGRWFYQNAAAAIQLSLP